MGLWLLIIVAFCLYVAADAAFDVSKKISFFVRLRALPFLGSVGARVWGRRPKRAAPAPSQVSEPAKTEHETPAHVSETPETERDEVRPEPRKFRIDWSALGAFLWKAKWLLLALVLFVVVVGTMRGCAPPFWGKSRDTLRAELKEARQSGEVLAHEADIARKAATLAERTHTETARTHAAVNRADEELENAVSADDFDALYRAYRFGYDGPDGVWNNSVRPDRGNPAPGGFAPMHSPRGDRA